MKELEKRIEKVELKVKRLEEMISAVAAKRGAEDEKSRLEELSERICDLEDLCMLIKLELIKINALLKDAGISPVSEALTPEIEEITERVEKLEKNVKRLKRETKSLKYTAENILKYMKQMAKILKKMVDVYGGARKFDEGNKRKNRET